MSEEWVEATYEPTDDEVDEFKTFVREAIDGRYNSLRTVPGLARHLPKIDGVTFKQEPGPRGTIEVSWSPR